MALNASTQALAKLEPYLLLAKSAHGAAAAKLITEVTAAPGCFVFAELLECDGIRELARDEKFLSSFRMLELFAFGTLADYHAAPAGTYPSLGEAHLAKLRLLTLVTLAATSRNLSYSTLIPQLGLGLGMGLESARRTGTSGCGESTSSIASSSVAKIRPRAMRQLEDIVIDAMYAGILSGRIDQQRQRLEVESVMGRDVRADEGVERLSQSMREWSTTTTQILASLATRIEDAKSKDRQRAQERSDHDASVKRVLTALANNQSNSPSAGNGGGSGGGRHAYDRLGSDRNGDVDMDDDAVALRKKKSSSGGSGRSKRSRA